METFAVTVFPVAQPDEWRAWAGSIASGDRADAHRQMMRRRGIRREHIRYQASPAGDVMVLVWGDVEQDRVAGLLAGFKKGRGAARSASPDRIRLRDFGTQRDQRGGQLAGSGAEVSTRGPGAGSSAQPTAAWA